MMPIPASPAPAAIASGAKDERKDADSGRLLSALTAANGVAGDDVAELVRDHALDLVHIVRSFDQAGLKIDRLTLRNEGVDLGIVEKNDLDAVRVEPCRLDERRATFAGTAAQFRCRAGPADRNRILLRRAGCQPAHASISASISRRTKRATGDFIECRLPLLALNADENERGPRRMHLAEGSLPPAATRLTAGSAAVSLFAAGTATALELAVWLLRLGRLGPALARGLGGRRGLSAVSAGRRLGGRGLRRPLSRPRRRPFSSGGVSAWVAVPRPAGSPRSAAPRRSAARPSANFRARPPARRAASTAAPAALPPRRRRRRFPPSAALRRQLRAARPAAPPQPGASCSSCVKRRPRASPPSRRLRPRPPRRRRRRRRPAGRLRRLRSSRSSRVAAVSSSSSSSPSREISTVSSSSSSSSAARLRRAARRRAERRSCRPSCARLRSPRRSGSRSRRRSAARCRQARRASC